MSAETPAETPAGFLLDTNEGWVATFRSPRTGGETVRTSTSAYVIEHSCGVRKMVEQILKTKRPLSPQQRVLDVVAHQEWKVSDVQKNLLKDSSFLVRCVETNNDLVDVIVAYLLWLPTNGSKRWASPTHAWNSFVKHEKGEIRFLRTELCTCDKKRKIIFFRCPKCFGRGHYENVKKVLIRSTFSDEV